MDIQRLRKLAGMEPLNEGHALLEDTKPAHIKDEEDADDNAEREKASKESERKGKEELKKLEALDTLTDKQKKRMEELKRDLCDD